MIVSKENKKEKRIEIDLTGPDGNAHVLIAKAQSLAKQLDLDGSKIVDEMMSSDYEELLEVFDRNFGDYVILYR